MSDALRQELKARADALGFDAFGIAPATSAAKASERLQEFLRHGRHGDMSWIELTAERRADPRQLMANARSIVMLGLSYAPTTDPLDSLNATLNSAISIYAKGRDYHDIMKGRLKELAGLIARRTNADVKVFVDTAPLMEKPLAASAGLGWQGKHTNLVSRSHGSWLFLGSILTEAELPVDAGEVDHCGTCRKCLDVCPTDAFPAPYQLDARRCIAYLTIEHQGHIAPEFRNAIGNRVFGCDDCLAVCPWNKFAEAACETKLRARAETDNPPIAELLILDDAAFRKRFAGTPVKRSGRARFLRNCLIAAGNSGDANLIKHVRALVQDDSPLVRAMAVWALAELTEPQDFETLRNRYLPDENDLQVIAEWQRETLTGDSG